MTTATTDAASPAARQPDGLASRAIDTPLGQMTIVASTTGLRAVLWPNDDPARVPSAQLTDTPHSPPPQPNVDDPPPPSPGVTSGVPEPTVGSAGPPRAEQGSRRRDAGRRTGTDEAATAATHLSAAATQLQHFFRYSSAAFDVPLDLDGTDFQRSVWTALADIPAGTTTTYGELAKRLGRPTGARAVGAAVGRNPVSIVLPCHRVVGSDGSLTGFAGGLDAKKWLLRHEGVLLA